MGLFKKGKNKNNDIFISDGISLSDEPIKITPLYLLKEIFGLNYKLPTPEEFFKDNPWYSKFPDTLISRYFKIKEKANELYEEVIIKYNLNNNTEIIDMTNTKWIIKYEFKSEVKYLYLETVENNVDSEETKIIYENRMEDVDIIEDKDITLLKYTTNFKDLNCGISNKLYYCIVLSNSNKI